MKAVAAMPLAAKIIGAGSLAGVSIGGAAKAQRRKLAPA
jgi:hypothetical protein